LLRRYPECRQHHPLGAIGGGLERGPCPDFQACDAGEHQLLLERSPDPTILAYLTHADDGSIRLSVLTVSGWVRELIDRTEHATFMIL
jgi:hypothetical protein